MDVESDRICVVRLKSERCCVSIIGVYLPTSNMPVALAEHREYVDHLEAVVSDCQRHGEVMIVGDFNAHIQYCESSGEVIGTNPPGLCMANLLDQSDLKYPYPVSMVFIPVWGPLYYCGLHHSGSHSGSTHRSLYYY